MKKLLLWDIDGTLTTSKGVGKRSMERTFFELYGIEGALEGIDMAGSLDFYIVDLAFAKQGMEAAEHFQAFWDLYARLLREESEGHAFLLPGVVETLGRTLLDDRLYNAVGTGNVEIGARTKLEMFYLNRFFPVGGFSEAREEQRYQVLQSGVKRAREYYDIDFAPEQVIVIGDTVKDIDAARKIGAQVIAVATGGHTYEMLEAAQPDLLVRTLEDEAFVRAVFGE